MSANKTPFTIHRTDHRRRGWRHVSKILLCTIIFCLLFTILTTVSYAENLPDCQDPACDGTTYRYEEFSDSQHTIYCDFCADRWLEDHTFNYEPISGTSMLYGTCRCGKISILGSITNGGSPEDGNGMGNSNTTQGTAPDIHTGAGTTVNTFAWDVYKVLCYLAIPCAIISLAYCGFQFLGSIFTGSYAGPGGGDMQKAQKQVIYTILGVILIFLLPRIFGWAISIFKINAWKPG